jgi:hypothetical protein
MAKRLSTHRGDVLILLTEQSYTTYAVGQVSRDGQQDFHLEGNVTYAPNRAAAMTTAKALVTTEGRIFIRNIDTDSWSTIRHRAQ